MLSIIALAIIAINIKEIKGFINYGKLKDIK